MSRLLVFRSVARYDALGCFAELLVAGLRQLGHEVDLVPFREPQLHERLSEAFSRRPDAVIAFNGVGVELEPSDRIYSRLGLRYLTIVVDHPLYLFERLATPLPRLLATFVDHTHVDFARQFIPSVTPHFLAHGASLPEGLPTGPRDIPLLLAGSYEDPEGLAGQWRALKPQTADLFEDVAERCLRQPGTGIYQHFRAAYTERGLPAEVMDRTPVLSLLHMPDRYVRARWRSDCLLAFERAGLTIDVYGHNWSAFRGATRHRFHPPVEFDAMATLMRRAQLVLAVGANFPTGSHERVLTAMAAGAATVSDHTAFYADSFTIGRDLLTYPQGQFDQLAATVRDLLADGPRLAALQEAGPRAIGDVHTWAGRARQVMALLG